MTSGEFTHYATVHIDHTQLDIQVTSKNGKLLGRPWLTLMIDEHSRNILAFNLTFDPPSADSRLTLLRECAHRHGRLPDCIIVDGGREFRSVEFERLTAHNGVCIVRRPPAKARFGSLIERMFGTINSQLIYRLAGNTQVTKRLRAVTQANDPKGQAVWTLSKLHDVLGHCY